MYIFAQHVTLHGRQMISEYTDRLIKCIHTIPHVKRHKI